MEAASEGPRGDDARVDVVQYPSGGVKAVPAGKGADIVRSRNRDRPRSVLRDRVVAGSGAVAAALVALFSIVTFGYSVLVLRNIFAGVLSAMVVAALAAVGLGVVVAVRWAQAGDAELLDEHVTLGDAREQWAAMPVSAVAPAEAPDREREHAFE